ncbi:MAG: hypothetical protein II295_03700 [Akkermansia sp.]|nr:hypothetical protein [Akkermansia sp.]
MKVEQKSSGSEWVSVVKVGMVCLTVLILGWMVSSKINDCLNAVKEPTDKVVENIKDAMETVKAKAAEIFGGIGDWEKVEIDCKTESGVGRVVRMYSLYENEIQVEYVYSTTWGGSTKRLALKEKYKVRYGIDASLEGWQASWISPNEIKLDKICPVVISCQRMGELVIEENDGLWNKIQPAEREWAQKELDAQAEARANKNEEAFASVKNEVIRGLNRDKFMRFRM